VSVASNACAEADSWVQCTLIPPRLLASERDHSCLSDWPLAAGAC